MSATITETEWRDCYYIYRAMHDGVCPSCGHHGAGEAFESIHRTIAVCCPNCDFHMTSDEVERVTKRSEHILKRRLESFDRVRGLLT